MTKSHRAQITEINQQYGDGRKLKRFERRSGASDVYQAHIAGEYEASVKHPRSNPFPPGRRHDAWEEGFKMADPLGDWHGRNE